MLLLHFRSPFWIDFDFSTFFFLGRAFPPSVPFPLTMALRQPWDGTGTALGMPWNGTDYFFETEQFIPATVGGIN